MFRIDALRSAFLLRCAKDKRMIVKKEWLVASAATVITLAISLAVIRWLAPQLLGIPIDLQMVSVDEKVSPFYEAVFREEDLSTIGFMLNDPYSGIRARPLFPRRITMGPNDLLGFRNRSVPNVADIVVVGDSQTYGNNSDIDQNWPTQLGTALKDKSRVIYNMSVGGWGAVQYAYAAEKAAAFQPRLMIIAFYTGNDSLESFIMAYNGDRWKSLRPDLSITSADIPRLERDTLPVRFSDGITTVFTPKTRYTSNMDHVAVKIGYKIMAKTARRISEENSLNGIRTLFTIIPTKELVYESKVSKENIDVSESYRLLVDAERNNISNLEKEIAGIPQALYIDVVSPLQKAALGSTPLYTEAADGHPVAYGYQVIGRAVANAIQGLMPPPLEGLYQLPITSKLSKYFLVDGNKLRVFANADVTGKNGWDYENAPIIADRDLAKPEFAGIITEVDQDRYGPTRIGKGGKGDGGIKF